MVVSYKPKVTDAALGSPLIIIGIDPSTKTGFCALNCSTGGVIKQCMISAPAKQTGIQRAMTIAYRTYLAVAEVLMMRQNNETCLVVFEGYGLASKTLSVSVTIGALIRAEIVGLGIPYLEVAPSTLKKYVTGSGSTEVKKEQMLLQAYKRWGHEFKDNNECDAFCLAKLGAMLLSDGKPTKEQIATVKALNLPEQDCYGLHQKFFDDLIQKFCT